MRAGVGGGGQGGRWEGRGRMGVRSRCTFSGRVPHRVVYPAAVPPQVLGVDRGTRTHTSRVILVMCPSSDKSEEIMRRMCRLHYVL